MAKPHTTMGIPPIPLPGGQQINAGRMVRTLLGAAIVVGLLAGWVDAHDTVDLVIWLGCAVLLIDPALLPVAVRALRAVKNGS